MRHQSFEVIALAKSLIGIESINPAFDPEGSRESRIAEFVVEWAGSNGLSAEIIGSERPSVIVRSAQVPGAATLMFCGHLDTVGVRGMDAPFAAEEQDGRLYGRGAYDMKAGLAASLIACREADHESLPINVVVAAVADEEYGSTGVQEVLAEMSADFAVVTEPTEMALGIAHKGFVWTQLDVTGRAAHGSRPHLGVDAITKMAPIITALAEYNEELAAVEHPLLGPGLVHASLISGEQEESTIPASSRLVVEHRTLPGTGAADVEAAVERILAQQSEADPDFVASAQSTMVRPPMEISADHELVSRFRQSYAGIRGQGPSVEGLSYWTDAAFISAAGIPTILFGPGGEGAHADVEWVSVRDSVDCAAVLTELARNLAAQ